jgi:hypothetical protein
MDRLFPVGVEGYAPCAPCAWRDIWRARMAAIGAQRSEGEACDRRMDAGGV